MMTYDLLHASPYMIWLTHWPLGDVQKSVKKIFSNANFWKCICWYIYKTGMGWKPWFSSKHWFRLWLGANVDQYRCRHMKSLGPNELKELFFHLLTELYDEKIGLVNEASGGPSTAPPEGMLYNYSWDQHVQTHRNKLLHDLSYRVASFISYIWLAS